MSSISNRIVTFVLIFILCIVCCILFFTFQKDTDSNVIQGDYSHSPTNNMLNDSPTPTASSVPSILDRVNLSTWSYYQEIALNSEYGNNQKQIIKKWSDDIKIYVNEFATDSDLTVIHTHIASLNLIPGIPDISIVDTVDVCNMRISFVTQNEMNKITEKNEEIAFGYTTIWWNQDAHITKAEIYVVCDKQDPLERQHTILEEITQALGLMNDSDRYIDSIFYVHYSDSILELSEMDWDLIRIHYCSEIKPGMEYNEVAGLYSQKTKR